MRIVLCLVFFLSGTAGLIFETLWFRMAGLTFGNSVWASSLVLASFMGGLALGIGMLVDNSIVMLENIDRHQSQLADPIEAAHVGAGEVASAVTASTFSMISSQTILL